MPRKVNYGIDYDEDYDTYDDFDEYDDRDYDHAVEESGYDHGVKGNGHGREGNGQLHILYTLMLSRLKKILSVSIEVISYNCPYAVVVSF